LEAEDAAYRVLGVNSVTNDLALDHASLGICPDGDIAADVRNALALDVAVPTDVCIGI